MSSQVYIISFFFFLNRLFLSIQTASLSSYEHIPLPITANVVLTLLSSLRIRAHALNQARSSLLRKSTKLF